jgi:hypothetical protein
MPSKIPSAFNWLLDTLAGVGGVPERRKLAYFSSEVSESYRHDLARFYVTSSIGSDEAESHLGLLLATRQFWELIPSGIFTSADPDYERFAANSLAGRFGEPARDEIVRSLALIFRNLRKAHSFGRRQVSSLDLCRNEHSRIYDTQNGRCATCGYKFMPIEVERFYDPDVFEAKEEAKVSDEEVILSSYNRRPVLDHIVPHFIGGDTPQNWQILCSSCNSGKGESISWMFRSGWMPIKRLGDVTNLTASCRYAVLSRHLSKILKSPLDCELRVKRKNPTQLLIFDNLDVFEVP